MNTEQQREEKIRTMIDVERLCKGCMRLLKEGQEICPICGYDNGMPEQRSVHALPENSILKGRYLIGRVLGEGGFGITYLAFDLAAERAVAVKEYFPSGLVARDGTAAQRDRLTVLSERAGRYFRQGLEKFSQEAGILYKFRELPGIVAVEDYFQENDTAYLVMEYVEGQSLKQYMQWYRKNSRGGAAMDYSVAIAFLEPVMGSLSQIHREGLIHRDISPDNIIVNAQGQVTLLDFGSARVNSEENVRSMTVMVKQGYAPEEQYRTHGKQGPWTDVYALCATLYHMISGELPMEAPERMYQDQVKPLKALNLTVPVPEAISDVIEKGMAVRAEQRYQSVEALHEALLRAQEEAERDKEAGDRTANVRMNESGGLSGAEAVKLDSEMPENNDKTESVQNRQSSVGKTVPLNGQTADPGKTVPLMGEAADPGKTVPLMGEAAVSGKTVPPGRMPEQADTYTNPDKTERLENAQRQPRNPELQPVVKSQASAETRSNAQMQKTAGKKHRFLRFAVPAAALVLVAAAVLYGSQVISGGEKWVQITEYLGLEGYRGDDSPYMLSAEEVGKLQVRSGDYNSLDTVPCWTEEDIEQIETNAATTIPTDIQLEEDRQKKMAYAAISSLYTETSLLYVYGSDAKQCSYDDYCTLISVPDTLLESNSYLTLNIKPRIPPVTQEDEIWLAPRSGDYEDKENAAYLDCSDMDHITVKFPQRFLAAGTFSENRAAVSIRNDEETGYYAKRHAEETPIRYGYIDGSGELVIPALFYSAGTFSNGLAAVSFETKKNQVYQGYIDTEGNLIYVFDPEQIPEPIISSQNQYLFPVREDGSMCYGFYELRGVAATLFSNADFSYVVDKYNKGKTGQWQEKTVNGGYLLLDENGQLQAELDENNMVVATLSDGTYFVHDMTEINRLWKTYNTYDDNAKFREKVSNAIIPSSIINGKGETLDSIEMTGMQTAIFDEWFFGSIMIGCFDGSSWSDEEYQELFNLLMNGEYEEFFNYYA